MNATVSTEVRSAIRRTVWASALLSSAALLTQGAYAHEPSETDARTTLSNVHDGAMQTASAQPASAQLYASPAQVRMVQQKLKEHGRKPGAVDGLWGEGTRGEVRDFQRANGLAATGQLDTSLLSALGIGNVLEGQTASGAFLDGLLRGEPGAKSAAAADAAAARGAPIYVSPEHVAQIQHLLREEGLYSGEIDGAWGEETSRAANKYRQAQGLEAHDGVDIALLRSLNREGKTIPQLASKVASRTEGAPLEAGATAIRALQRELGESGHEAVDVDGEWGEQTRQALRQFQREHELEATGTLTLPTLAALGLDVANKAGKPGIEAQMQREAEQVQEQAQDAVATAEDESED